jgi:hypothetical protein
MTISITDDKMTSPDSHHAAVRIGSTHSWRVTWLRQDHRLTRNEAITAMTIASVVGASDEKITRQDPIWGHVNSWAHELGLEGEGAIGYAMQPCKWEV